MSKEIITPNSLDIRVGKILKVYPVREKDKIRDDT